MPRRCWNSVTFLCIRLLAPFLLLSSSLCFYCIKINTDLPKNTININTHPTPQFNLLKLTWLLLSCLQTCIPTFWPFFPSPSCLKYTLGMECMDPLMFCSIIEFIISLLWLCWILELCSLGITSSNCFIPQSLSSQANQCFLHTWIWHIQSTPEPPSNTIYLHQA